MRMAAISGRITGGVPLDVRIGLFLMPSIDSSTASLSDIAVREERIARFSAYAPPPLIPRRYAPPSLRSSPLPSRRRSSCSGLKYPVNCAVGSSLGLAGADGRAVGKQLVGALLPIEPRHSVRETVSFSFFPIHTTFTCYSNKIYTGSVAAHCVARQHRRSMSARADTSPYIYSLRRKVGDYYCLCSINTRFTKAHRRIHI